MWMQPSLRQTSGVLGTVADRCRASREVKIRQRAAADDFLGLFKWIARAASGGDGDRIGRSSPGTGGGGRGIGSSAVYFELSDDWACWRRKGMDAGRLIEAPGIYYQRSGGGGLSGHRQKREWAADRADRPLGDGRGWDASDRRRSGRRRALGNCFGALAGRIVIWCMRMRRGRL